MLNEKGSTLIENVISIFLLSIFAVMVFTALSAGLSALQRSQGESETLYNAYTEIETTEYDGSDVTTSSTELNDTNDTLSFTFEYEDSSGRTQSATYDIEGTSVYDSNNIMGEFYRND